jgi:hypothetical protein
MAAFSRPRAAASLIFGEMPSDVKQKRNKSGVTDFHFIDQNSVCRSGVLGSAVRNGRFETHLNAASRSLGTPRRDASGRRVEIFLDGVSPFLAFEQAAGVPSAARRQRAARGLIDALGFLRIGRACFRAGGVAVFTGAAAAARVFCGRRPTLGGRE